MSEKRFAIGFIIAVLVLFSGVCLYNYKVDSFGIFRGDFSRPRNEPNQHFVKMRYLINNPDKYDSYCFGSSRVGNIDLTKIDDGYKYYNMTYSEGLPAEWLTDVKLMLKNKITIKRVILGIDDFSFRINPKSHHTQYLRIPYQKKNLHTYLTYLLKAPPSSSPFNENGSVFDIYKTGRPLHEKPDMAIEENPEKHITDPKFKEPCLVRGNLMKETLSTLKELKLLADSNDIELIVFINPIHKTTYFSNPVSEFNEFKRGLVEITDYYDFSGLNKITTNNYNYYETSHYRPLVGDLIVERIFHEPKDKVTDFGVYVTRENSEEHLAKLLAEEANLK